MIKNSYLSILFTAGLALLTTLSSAQTLTEALPGFNKITVSPMINLVLSQGEDEHIRIEYDGIDPEKINYSVRGKRLRIYLDDARYTVKNEETIKDGYSQKVPVYKGAKVTAYVTYKSLKNLQVRGEEKVICEDSLVSKKFKIKLFGETEVDLAFLQTGRLKIHAFGENELIIRAGNSEVQTFRLFGENKINTENMYAESIASSFFGESSLKLYASEELSLWGFGEVKMQYSGQPQLKRFVIGTTSVTSR